MTKGFVHIGSTLLVLLAAAPVGAQTVLTVDQAVQQTLDQNAGLRRVRSSAGKAEADFAETRAARFPRVVLAETWQQGNQPVFVFGSVLASRQFGCDNFAIGALNQPNPTGLFHSSLVVEHVVFDFGGRRSVIAGARGVRDAAGLSVDEARAVLAVSTVETYGRILVAEAGAHAAATALEAARADRLRAVNRRDAGMATDGDVLALEAHVAELEERRIQAEGDAAIARAALNRLTGSPVDRRVTVVEPVSPPVDRADIPSLILEAERHRPEMSRAAVGQETSRAALRGARASSLPQIAVRAGVDLDGTSFGARRSSWIVGAETRWAFSLGGAERARTRAAAAAAAGARAEADDVRAAVQLDVVTAAYQVQSAQARLVAGRARVAQARESQRVVRERVDAGLGTITDLLRASTALIDALEAQTAASVDALVGDARLKRALGRQP